VRAAFTGRDGGVSAPPYDSLNLSAGSGDTEVAVARNRGLLAAACGLAPAQVTWMRQVHGADVGQVPEAASPAAVSPAQARDASFTSVPGLALGVLCADCPAVLLADPAAGLIGAAHSGRTGTAFGVVPALVRAMTGAGADPARMRAVIGPAICGACYEVPEQMRNAVAAVVPGSACVTRAGTPGLDLRAGLAAQLAAEGVRRVQTDARCTAEDPGLYSYRRDGRTGRFAGLVWLAP
jgi:purine-nucleoside/S-methyl-5'-thioadenosine phosphorylase / adenosine deaminase